jgi:dethiobiotin synthetase
MNAPTDAEKSDPATPARVAGFGVIGVTPDDQTTLAAAMLIAMLTHQGANVAAMVPVETGIDDPCEPGSRGSLVRWAAGHLDNPRLVTPFALAADRPAMHAADESGTLLHSAAFDRARDELCEGRTTLVVLDAIGPLDPITPSLTLLDLVERWALAVVLVVPISRWAIGHARLLESLLLPRQMRVAGMILSPKSFSDDLDVDAVTAIEDTLAATLGCPVVRLPPVLSVHDRGELLAAADACALHRIARHSGP